MRGGRCPAVALAPVPAAGARLAWERTYLSDVEASLVGPKVVEKRRAEFVAGRLAAKAAAGLLLGRAWDRERIAVLRQGGATTGPPRLALSCSPDEVRVSISHADGIAVAAASREAVGIDVVAVERQGPEFERDAFAPGELDAWRRWVGRSAPAEEAGAIAFAAKEAALKWKGTGLTVPLQEVIVLPVEAGSDGGDARTRSLGDLRVLKVSPGAADVVVGVPQTELRVRLDEPGPRERPVLPARVLRLGNRVAFLVWGPDGARPRA